MYSASQFCPRRPPPNRPIPPLPSIVDGDDDDRRTSYAGSRRNGGQWGPLTDKSTMFAQETASGAPSAVHNPHAPADGKIKIKIQVVQPSSDSAHDQPLWAIKVDEDITLGAFLERASAKIGFAPALLSGLDAAEHICTEESFARWVAGRVRDGRNYPILAYPATNVRASS